MRLKRIKAGKSETENNVFLAPLAGFTEFAFREICSRLGAGLTFTEMVSAKGLYYGDKKTRDLLRVSPYEKIKCAQIFGNDPDIMKAACESEALENFDLIDINFGCPMPKIYDNGEGSAILKNPSLAEKIIKKCSESGKEITCKMRIGLTDKELIGVDFAKAAEQGGAKMITVHGRTKDKIYAGAVNFDEIAKIKSAVKIPVVANGGVFDVSSAEELLENTGADGIMLARGALENPFLFSEITGKKPFVKDKKELIFYHIDRLLTASDDETVAVTLRKHLCLYLKGIKNSAAVKQKLLSLKSTDEIKAALDEFFDGEKRIQP